MIPEEDWSRIKISVPILRAICAAARGDRREAEQLVHAPLAALEAAQRQYEAIQARELDRQHRLEEEAKAKSRQLKGIMGFPPSPEEIAAYRTEQRMREIQRHPFDLGRHGGYQSLVSRETEAYLHAKSNLESKIGYLESDASSAAVSAEQAATKARSYQELRDVLQQAVTGLLS